MLRLSKKKMLSAVCNECGREHAFELEITGRTPTLKEKQRVTEEATKDQWFCYKEDVYCLTCKSSMAYLQAKSR